MAQEKIYQKKSLKKNTFYNVLKTCSSIIFPLVTFPYISRILSPEYVGKINFSVSYVSYFSMLASLGFSTYAIRECAALQKNKEELSTKASQLFSINLLMTVISYMLLSVSLVIFRTLDAYRILIVIQSVGIIFVTLGADWLNSAMEDFKYITLRTFAFQLFSLWALLVFVKEPEDYVEYALISLVSSCGANLSNIFYRRKYCTIKLVRRTEWKRHLPAIVVLFVMLLSQSVFSNVDITMLGIIKGNYEVGLYSTAVKITDLVSQMILSILWVMLPRLSMCFGENDFYEINTLLSKALSFFVTLGIPCVTGILFLSKDILLLMAGEKYVGAEFPLKILMLSFLFDLFGGGFVGNLILLPSKKEKYFMAVCCVIAGVNVVLNCIIIPIFGASGAAGTTAFCRFLMLILLFFKIDKRIKISCSARTIFASLIGGGGIAVLCWLVKLAKWTLLSTVIFSVLGGMILYGLIQIVLKNDIVQLLFSSAFMKLKSRK